MALDLRLELRLRRPAEIGQDDVERVQLVEVAVPADRRGRGRHTRSSVPAGSCLVPSGSALALGGMLYNTQCTQVIFGAAGSGASGSSTISKLRLGRYAGPGERQRDVLPIAGVFRWNFAPMS